MPSVLFVCSANMCRSPMASALFRKLVAQRPDAAEWRIESAGVWALAGSPASTGARVAMQARGLDLSGHVSRPVTHRMLRQFDLILVMEDSHKEALRGEFRDLAGRIYLLTEMVGEGDDIRDPIGGRQVDYDDTVRELEDILTRGIVRIEQLTQMGRK
ncbi:MAG: hypothetical protein JW726_01235 [Anaerolineales bacterium]|nr:hypothetical protein [Anaerolineales bacterium]